jgi:hypothetical protein
MEYFTNMFTFLFRMVAVAPAACDKTFLGLTPWYHYLSSSDFSSNGCAISNFTFLPTAGAGGSDIPLILLAIVDDLLRIAGIVAVAFVIYGGYQYVTSQGQPEKTARAQNTITDALVGVAIAVAAISIVTFLGDKLS